MKVNKVFQVLTGDLGVDISIPELKSLNKYLQAKQLETQDQDAQFLD